MKAVAYSIKPFDKAYLAKANQKKHDITLISNLLNADTAIYADGKDAVIVFTNDDISANVIEKLAQLGVKHIITRSSGIDPIDGEAAIKYGIKLSNISSYSTQAVAEHTVALAFALNRQLIRANQHVHSFDFNNDELIGFNFFDKTVGLVGLEETGLAVARIFNGMGCKVIGFDPAFPTARAHNVQPVTLEVLLRSSDIISLHLPLTDSTKYFINKNALYQMKAGVMLINTARSELIRTVDVLDALESGKVGYLGLDVCEYSKRSFFEDQEHDHVRYMLLEKLIQYPNVLITPYMAYLTKEALQDIAVQIIDSLDMWQLDKCLSKAC